MTMNRTQLEESLEAYALDLLDKPAVAAVEEALVEHPDLVDRVAAIRETLVALAYEDGAVSPPPVRDSVLAAALESRGSGYPIDRVLPAAALDCYSAAANDLAAVLDTLGDDEWQAPTVYAVPVIELIQHLSGVDALLAARLRGERELDDASVSHVTFRDDGADVTDPPSVVDRWRRHSEMVVEAAAGLSTAAWEREIDFFGLRASADAVLVARAFELWTHTEDICRATDRALRPPPTPVLRTMADAAVNLLGHLISTSDAHRRKTLRITLTGAGGGSWLASLDRPADSGIVDPTHTADATIVADVVDFCRLCADRMRPPNQLRSQRLGDRALADDVVRLAPMLADFGEAVGTGRV